MSSTRTRASRDGLGCVVTIASRIRSETLARLLDIPSVDPFEIVRTGYLFLRALDDPGDNDTTPSHVVAVEAKAPTAHVVVAVGNGCRLSGLVRSRNAWH